VRVLIADDELAIREMLRDALVDEGHVVRTAPDGREALLVARTWHPDVIVLDLMMPAMNGWQFAETYRRLRGPHAAIVGITAAGLPAIRSAQNLGLLAAVLAKPLNLTDLLKTVEAATSNAAAAA
jgi:CheY-like chemotaxis protein